MNRNNDLVYTRRYYIGSADGAYRQEIEYDEELFDPLDELGATFVYGEDKNYQQEVLSPDKKSVARLLKKENPSDRFSVSTQVEITDLTSKKSTVYEIPEEEIGSSFGILINKWSLDSSKVYIMGGIYEIAAPANLWEIDVKNEKTRHYKGFEGFSFPVDVIAQNGKAYTVDDAYGGLDTVADLDKSRISRLLEIDLATGDTKVVDEVAGKITNFYVSDSLGALYTKEYSDGQVVREAIRRLDFSTQEISTIFESDAVAKGYNAAISLNGHNDDSTHIFYQEKNDILFEDIKSKQKYKIGLASQNHCEQTIHGTNYIENIYGVTENPKKFNKVQ